MASSASPSTPACVFGVPRPTHATARRLRRNAMCMEIGSAARCVSRQRRAYPILGCVRRAPLRRPRRARRHQPAWARCFLDTISKPQWPLFGLRGQTEPSRFAMRSDQAAKLGTHVVKGQWFAAAILQIVQSPCDLVVPSRGDFLRCFACLGFDAGGQALGQLAACGQWQFQRSVFNVFKEWH